MSSRAAFACTLAGGLLLVAACDTKLATTEAASPGRPQLHSSALAVSADGTRLYVTHPDADSVSQLSTLNGQILHEQLLAASAPKRDAAGRYEPSVGPRALALNTAGDRLYVTGQRSGHVYALDAATLAVQNDVFVCAEPMGVLLSADDASVFVACAQDDQVVQDRTRADVARYA